MNTHQSLTVAAAWLLATGAFAAESAFQFVGKASDSGSLVYEEHHVVAGTCSGGTWQPDTHSVDYRKPDTDRTFATKELDYQHSPLRPEMAFQQLDFNESLIVKQADDNTLAIRWQTPSGKTEAFNVSFNDSVVVDAGFDNFVRRNWDSVVAERSVDFRFLGPTRGEHYGFVMEPASTDRTEAAHIVRIRPSGMIARFLVDPIILGYSDSGALTDYIGLSNIRESEDGNYTVHIRYEVTRQPDCELTP
ncbi:hypothetical protein [uncultured Marinobacter sp.]|uniref:hypothetical protein n=1 Tax=uncultured Marinobacter sp. TaxID=187379 RepID=UPI00261E9198|nr:hypothetical protein [uncultured Marinobacter sp.]